MDLRNRECLKCQKIFKPKRPHQTFCNRMCRYQYHNEEKMRAVKLMKSGVVKVEK